MNDKRRQLLHRAVNSLDVAELLVAQALDEEQDALDSMPENLEASERYEKMETAVELLEEVIENIGAARSEIDEATA